MAAAISATKATDAQDKAAVQTKVKPTASKPVPLAKTTKRCRECDTPKRLTSFVEAKHFGGGSYKKAGRYFTSSLCSDCAIDLKKDAEKALAKPGSDTNVGALHWSAQSIVQAAHRAVSLREDREEIAKGDHAPDGFKWVAVGAKVDESLSLHRHLVRPGQVAALCGAATPGATHADAVAAWRTNTVKDVCPKCVKKALV